MQFATLALAGIAAAASCGTFYFAFKINKNFSATVENLETEVETVKKNVNKSIRGLQVAIASADLEV